MEILFHKKFNKKKEKEKEIIINKNNTNEYYKLIVKYIIKNKENKVIIKLIELEIKQNNQNQIYLVNKSNYFYSGEFQENKVKDFLEKLEKRSYNKKFNIIKEDNIITIEKIILKDKKSNNIIKDNPANEEYTNMPNFNCKKYNKLPRFGAYNQEIFEFFIIINILMNYA